MFNVDHIVQNAGVLGGLLIIGAIIFSESGLLIGFFLPGDTLLLSGGIFAAQGKLPLGWLILVIVLAAVIGDNVGYSIGRRMGKRIFRKKDGLLFHYENVVRAEKFYEKHGGKTIILARFMPVVRTFAPVVAGVGKMQRQHFMAYNVVGGALWGIGVTLAGYFVGNKIPSIDKYIGLTLLAVTVLTFGPALYHLFGQKDNRQLLLKKVRSNLSKVFLNKKVD